MPEIQILYVQNIISRKKNHVAQKLFFLLKVANLGFNKSVRVSWAGESGDWQILDADFHSCLNSGFEYWVAETEIQLSEQRPLPGNIQFSAELQHQEQGYWDNNQGSNYRSEADSGIRLLQGQTIQNIDFKRNVSHNQRSVPVKIAIQHSVPVDSVRIQWTSDNWISSKETECHFKIDYWDKLEKSNARNGNQYGVQIWKAKLKVNDAFRIQYVVNFEKDGQRHWDNNFGFNYELEHPYLRVLILNLHCYQEPDQDYKFSQIAYAIDKEHADIVCFQEVAENWNGGDGDWDSNSANIINQRLIEPYHLYTDWSHIGFDRFREGVAILSRHPIQQCESRYVSDDEDCYSIHSRKVVMAEIDVPVFGKLNIFSAHLSWWEDGFERQLENLSRWAKEKEHPDTCATLLCGDFNVTAGSQGYELVVEQKEYLDQFLAVNNKGLFDQIYRVNDAHWRDLLSDDYRIDYIFQSKNGGLTAVDAKVLFTENDYGQVSDHCGYLVSFEPIISK